MSAHLSAQPARIFLGGAHGALRGGLGVGDLSERNRGGHSSL